MDGMLKPLDWDTQFFGFKAAALEVDRHDDGFLLEQVENARRNKVVLLTYFAPVGTKINSPLEHNLVDTRYVYTHDLNNHFLQELRDPPDIIEHYEDKNTTPELEALGIISGMHSRFFYDPVFPEPAAKALYLSWTRQCIDRTRGDLVLVARGGSGEIAAMFANRTDAEGIIHPALMSAFPEMRGLGLGAGFFTYCMRWAREQGHCFGRINTQGRNHLARNIYERLGWELESRTDIFHIWLQSPTIKTAYF